MSPADPGRPTGPSLGGALRAHRLDAGLSQAELAARLAIHPGEVARIERNDRLPEADLLEACIAALELASDEGAALRTFLAARVEVSARVPSGEPVSAPTVWGVPGRNAHFTGRDEVLNELRRRLAGGLRAVILPVALRGLGGVGKTQLALEFAHRFKADYDIVWWIDAEQLELIDASFALLADRMGLATSGNVPADARQVREALRRGEPYARWLLVFDNAAEPDDLVPYLPDPGAVGHLLITSRDQSWASVAATLEVDVYSRPESITRLTAVVRDLAPEDAESIAELVGDLPLAVESAAAWLATTGTPVNTYLDSLAAETLRVLSLEQPRGYALPAAAVWSLSLKRLREQSPAAAHLLELASFMSPDGIAAELFYTSVGIRPLRALDERVTDALAIGSLVRSIVRLSLMRTDADQLRVHRLVQESVRAQLTRFRANDTVHEVHRILSAARPESELIDDPAAWPRYALLWHHLAPSMAAECDEPPVRELLIDRVRFLWNIGEYQRALGFAREIAELWAIRLHELGGENSEPGEALHRQILVLRAQIAAVLRSEGSLSEAHELDAETLKRQRELLPDQHPDTLLTVVGLAADLRGRGEFGEALIMDQTAYENHVAALGAEHPRTLAAASNLAVSSRLVGDRAFARRLDEETLARRRDVLGPAHPSTLASLMHCGLDLLAVGDYEEAVRLLAAAMTGLVDSLGGARPYTLRAATMLAWALGRTGRHAESLALAEETAAQYAAKYRPHYPDALMCTMTLAAAFSAHGPNQRDQDRAVRTARSALAGFEERFGPLHPSTLACANNLAVYELRAGRGAEAHGLLEHARDALTGRLGPEHPDLRIITLNLATTLRALRGRREARRFGPAALRAAPGVELAPAPL